MLVIKVVLFTRTAAGGTPQLISATHPYQALLEGVFLDLSQAELYISTLQKYSSQNTTRLRRNISKPYPFDPEILNPVMQVLYVFSFFFLSFRQSFASNNIYFS